MSTINFKGKYLLPEPGAGTRSFEAITLNNVTLIRCIDNSMFRVKSILDIWPREDVTENSILDELKDTVLALRTELKKPIVDSYTAYKDSSTQEEKEFPEDLIGWYCHPIFAELLIVRVCPNGNVVSPALCTPFLITHRVYWRKMGKLCKDIDALQKELDTYHKENEDLLDEIEELEIENGELQKKAVNLESFYNYMVYTKKSSLPFLDDHIYEIKIVRRNEKNWKPKHEAIKEGSKCIFWRGHLNNATQINFQFFDDAIRPHCDTVYSRIHATIKGSNIGNLRGSLGMWFDENYPNASRKPVIPFDLQLEMWNSKP